MFDRSAIKREYDDIRNKNLLIKQHRKHTVYSTVPEIIELEHQRVNISRTINMKLISGQEVSDLELENYKNDIKNIMQQKLFLLTENNYPSNYLDDIYSCTDCKDTGVLDDGHTWCHCYREKITKQLLKNSNMEDVLKRENFKTFTLDLFSTTVQEDYNISVRDHMRNMLDMAKVYTADFGMQKNNVILSGSTGTGKTFLTHCIAENLINRGFMVVYFTAIEMLEFIKSANFNSDANSMQMIRLIKSADLLILDDLGTEYASDYNNTELFSIINYRMIREDKATIISTNLSMNEIRSRYSERLSSRIVGNCDNWVLFGNDLRMVIKFGDKIG